MRATCYFKFPWNHVKKNYDGSVYRSLRDYSPIISPYYPDLVCVTLRARLPPAVSSRGGSGDHLFHGARQEGVACGRAFPGCYSAPEMSRAASEHSAAEGKECVLHGALPRSALGPRAAPALAQHLRGALGPSPGFWAFGRTSLTSPATASLRAGPAAHPVPRAAVENRPGGRGGRAASRTQAPDAPRPEPHESHARRKWRQPRGRRAVPVAETRSSKNATRGVSAAQAQPRPSAGAPPHCHV